MAEALGWVDRKKKQYNTKDKMLAKTKTNKYRVSGWETELWNCTQFIHFVTHIPFPWLLLVL